MDREDWLPCQLVWVALVIDIPTSEHTPMRGSFVTTLSRLPCRPLQFRARIQPLASSSTLCPGSKFTGRTYRLIHPLGPQRTETAPSIWKALDDVDESKQFVVTGPSSDDDRSLSWPLFKHEFEMQKLFNNSVFIRQMIDFIPIRSRSRA